MKYLWYLAFFLWTSSAYAQTIPITDVKVSVTAESAAIAREQSLDQAHDLAFQKLLNENFPENSGLLPSHDAITDMVSDFSIDREKTTPTSYTASLTFQFDTQKVQAWMQKREQSPSLESSFLSPDVVQGSAQSLKAMVSYTTLSEWQNIKKILEHISIIQKVTVSSFSPKNATLDIVYQGDVDKLRDHLLQEGIVLSHQEDSWLMSSNRTSIR